MIIRTGRILIFEKNVFWHSFHASEGKKKKETFFFSSVGDTGCPGVPRVNFMITYINVTSFDVSWDVPHAHGGAIITAYTLWLRELATNRSTHGLWFLINTTEPKFRLKLNCCRTYEIMVTAWNKYGQSFTDPDNAAKITVLRGTMLLDFFFPLFAVFHKTTT